MEKAKVLTGNEKVSRVVRKGTNNVRVAMANGNTFLISMENFNSIEKDLLAEKTIPVKEIAGFEFKDVEVKLPVKRTRRSKAQKIFDDQNLYAEAEIAEMKPAPAAKSA